MQSLTHAIRLQMLAGVTLVLFTLTSCGGAPTTTSDPPGALVRLQRADNVSTLPGDLTLFTSGVLQLHLYDRGALRKQIDPSEPAELRSALTDPALSTLANVYPPTLGPGAGDTLTIYGAQRRSIRYDSAVLDRPAPFQRFISLVMRLRGRFLMTRLTRWGFGGGGAAPEKSLFGCYAAHSCRIAAKK